MSQVPINPYQPPTDTSLDRNQSVQTHQEPFVDERASISLSCIVFGGMSLVFALGFLTSGCERLWAATDEISGWVLLTISGIIGIAGTALIKAGNYVDDGEDAKANRCLVVAGTVAAFAVAYWLTA